LFLLVLIVGQTLQRQSPVYTFAKSPWANRPIAEITTQIHPDVYTYACLFDHQMQQTVMTASYVGMASNAHQANGSGQVMKYAQATEGQKG
jgi:hypothetical protein